MADLGDEAQLLTEMEREAAIAALRARRAAGGAGAGGICIDCDEPIPLPRLAAIPGAERCLPCQEAAERRR